MIDSCHAFNQCHNKVLSFYRIFGSVMDSFDKILRKHKTSLSWTKFFLECKERSSSQERKRKWFFFQFYSLNDKCLFVSDLNFLASHFSRFFCRSELQRTIPLPSIRTHKFTTCLNKIDQDFSTFYKPLNMNSVIPETLKHLNKH